MPAFAGCNASMCGSSFISDWHLGDVHSENMGKSLDTLKAWLDLAAWFPEVFIYLFIILFIYLFIFRVVALFKAYSRCHIKCGSFWQMNTC